MRVMPTIHTAGAVAVAVVALSVAGIVSHGQGGGRQPATPAAGPPAQALPEIALAVGDGERLTKIELSRPDDDDASLLSVITLERQGRDWELTSPIRARASGSKVQELVANLGRLQVWKRIDDGTGLYDQDDLTDGKALHVVAWQGTTKRSDFFCGKSSTAGQLARVAGQDGIFALVNWGPRGYQGFLYTRALRSWRETSVFAFDADAVVAVEITNRSGRLVFSRTAHGWAGSLRRRRRGGELGQLERTWSRFDPSRVDDLLTTFKSLSADDFGRRQDRASSGVDDAEATGGVLRIELAGDPSEVTLRVGKPTKSNGNSRWNIEDSRWAVNDGDDGALYVLAPWTAGWVTAGPARFERAQSISMTSARPSQRQ
jgi:uncharacterized protein DUF4340